MEKAKGKRICEVCGEGEIIKDAAMGVSACNNCGAVAQESDIVIDEPTFSKEADGSSSIVGQFVPLNGMHSRRGPGPAISDGSVSVSREQTRAMAHGIINRLSSQLSVVQSISDQAFRVFTLASDSQHKFVRGRKVDIVAAACLYVAVRIAEKPPPVLLVDLAEAIGVDVYALGATYLKLCRAIEFPIKELDPSVYIDRFASRLGFGPKLVQVENTATAIVRRMKSDWMQTGRRSTGICGAAILIAARMHGFHRTPAEVVQVVRVCDTTLRRRLTEFADTKAATLTGEEFDKQAPVQEESMPPAYTKAREREETERAHVELWKRRQNGESIESLLEVERRRIKAIRVGKARKAAGEELTTDDAGSDASSTGKRDTASGTDRSKSRGPAAKKPKQRRKARRTDGEKDDEDEEDDAEDEDEDAEECEEDDGEEEYEDDSSKKKTRKQRGKGRRKAEAEPRRDDVDQEVDEDYVEREVREMLSNAEFLKIEATAKRVLESQTRVLNLAEIQPEPQQQQQVATPQEAAVDGETTAGEGGDPNSAAPKPVAESLDDIPDEEVDMYLQTGDQSRLKEIAWDEMYGEFMAARKEKQDAAALRKGRPRGKRTKQAEAGSAAEATREALKRKGSSRVNYNVLQNLLSVKDDALVPHADDDPFAETAPAETTATATTRATRGGEEDYEDDEDREQQGLSLAERIAGRNKAEDDDAMLRERLGLETRHKDDDDDDDDLFYGDN